MRVVASLTTLPWRYGGLLETIKSIKNQSRPPDAIYLTLPPETRRNKTPYPPLPSEVEALCTPVRIEKDYGPVCKILGALLNEYDPDTTIIIFDDDVIYPEDMIAKMMEYNDKQTALASSGAILKYGFPFYSTHSNAAGLVNEITSFRMSKEGREVDLLCGFSAVLYMRKFFNNVNELIELAESNEDVYYNDDVLLSAYVAKRGIKRKVYPDIPDIIKKKQAPDQHAISYDKLQFLNRFRGSIQYLHDKGYFPVYAEATYDETIGGRVFIIIVFVIILILASILFYKKVLR